MNARTDTAVLQSALNAAGHHLSNAHLDALEEETIFILREV
ncbi:MAG: sulfate adenylyltransferase small subunit, partial [Comamonadaceae bacterium]|nr:sulfate adenylyltransferase small subunit [Comamonadaceae bacterium]